jgi:hypothetical protein
MPGSNGINSAISFARQGSLADKCAVASAKSKGNKVFVITENHIAGDFLFGVGAGLPSLPIEKDSPNCESDRTGGCPSIPLLPLPKRQKAKPHDGKRNCRPIAGVKHNLRVRQCSPKNRLVSEKFRLDLRCGFRVNCQFFGSPPLLMSKYPLKFGEVGMVCL